MFYRSWRLKKLFICFEGGLEWTAEDVIDTGLFVSLDSQDAHLPPPTTTQHHQQSGTASTSAFAKHSPVVAHRQLPHHVASSTTILDRHQARHKLNLTQFNFNWHKIHPCHQMFVNDCYYRLLQHCMVCVVLCSVLMSFHNSRWILAGQFSSIIL